VPRDPALKPYRIALYCVYGAACAVLFLQLVRSVVGDLYGRRRDAVVQQSPTACLEDVERLYGQLSARAMQPAPGGLEGGALAREWDAWSRRWQDEVDRVERAVRIGLGQRAGVARAGRRSGWDRGAAQAPRAVRGRRLGGKRAG